MPRGNKNNEFEDLQSDAALRSLVQGMEQELQNLKGSMQSAQDTFAKVQEVLSSDSFKKILNVIDTGNDEAESGTVTGESGARALDRLVGNDAQQFNLNALNEALGETFLQNAESSGIRRNNFMGQSSDDRFWTNLIRMKAVGGEVDPDSLAVVLDKLGGKK